MSAIESTIACGDFPCEQRSFMEELLESIIEEEEGLHLEETGPDDGPGASEGQAGSESTAACFYRAINELYPLSTTTEKGLHQYVSTKSLGCGAMLQQHHVAALVVVEDDDSYEDDARYEGSYEDSDNEESAEELHEAADDSGRVGATETSSSADVATRSGDDLLSSLLFSDVGMENSADEQFLHALVETLKNPIADDDDDFMIMSSMWDDKCPDRISCDTSTTNTTSYSLSSDDMSSLHAQSMTGSSTINGVVIDSIPSFSEEDNDLDGSTEEEDKTSDAASASNESCSIGSRSITNDKFTKARRRSDNTDTVSTGDMVITFPTTVHEEDEDGDKSTTTIDTTQLIRGSWNDKMLIDVTSTRQDDEESLALHVSTDDGHDKKLSPHSVDVSTRQDANPDEFPSPLSIDASTKQDDQDESLSPLSIDASKMQDHEQSLALSVWQLDQAILVWDLACIVVDLGLTLMTTIPGRGSSSNLFSVAIITIR